MPPTLTGLRRVAPERVELEVDGRRWRTVPDAVVLRMGLAAGMELDRPTLRTLRRELERARGLRSAARVLARHDVSVRRLTERVGRTAPREAGGVVRSLADAGLVDDGRAAASRARALASRGWGDAAIEARLEGEGFEEETTRAAVAALEPEAARAAVLTAAEGDPVRAVRRLAQRGFSADVVEEAAASLDAPGAGEVGCSGTT